MECVCVGCPPQAADPALGHPALPAVNMAPGVILACVACVPLLLWMYRPTLMGGIQGYDAVLEEVRTFRITDWPLFAKCCEWQGLCIKSPPAVRGQPAPCLASSLPLCTTPCLQRT